MRAGACARSRFALPECPNPSPVRGTLADPDNPGLVAVGIGAGKESRACTINCVLANHLGDTPREGLMAAGLLFVHKALVHVIWTHCMLATPAGPGWTRLFTGYSVPAGCVQSVSQKLNRDDVLVWPCDEKKYEWLAYKFTVP